MLGGSHVEKPAPTLWPLLLVGGGKVSLRWGFEPRSGQKLERRLQYFKTTKLEKRWGLNVMVPVFMITRLEKRWGLNVSVPVFMITRLEKNWGLNVPVPVFMITRLEKRWGLNALVPVFMITRLEKRWGLSFTTDRPVSPPQSCHIRSIHLHLSHLPARTVT